MKVALLVIAISALALTEAHYYKSYQYPTNWLSAFRNSATNGALSKLLSQLRTPASINTGTVANYAEKLSNFLQTFRVIRVVDRSCFRWYHALCVRWIVTRVVQKPDGSQKVEEVIENGNSTDTTTRMATDSTTTTLHTTAETTISPDVPSTEDMFDPEMGSPGVSTAGKSTIATCPATMDCRPSCSDFTEPAPEYTCSGSGNICCKRMSFSDWGV